MHRLFRIWAVALLVAGILPANAGTSASSEFPRPLTAAWIWRQGADPKDYNQTVIATRRVSLEAASEAVLRITADCYYRLYINGAWVNDGPARNYPDHFQYDTLDVTGYLIKGENEIKVIARYYGVGDFHHLPQQAGLLAQLDVKTTQGKIQSVLTDKSWKVATAKAWLPNTPKVSIQMEPAEWYDAREEELKFERAVEWFKTTNGPWKNLAPRDTALLSRQPVTLKAFLGAKLVKTEALDFCLPAARLANPGVVEANHSASCVGGLVACLINDQTCPVQLEADGMKFSIDGVVKDDGRYSLAPGRHVVLAFTREVTSHNKERSLRFWDPAGFRLENPINRGQTNPWCYLDFKDLAFATNDMVWIGFPRSPEVTAKITEYNRLTDGWLKEIINTETLKEKLEPRCRVMDFDKMFVRDSAWQFQHRRVVGDASTLIQHPQALMHNTADATLVTPSPQGDIELLYDLGEQNCGYYSFDLVADAGVCVDIYGLEYIAEDGRIQHSWGNRNGLRYLTKAGENHFTSLKRRSGRYVFITLRNQKTPVRIRNFTLIESTYPVNYIGNFSCSDSRLDNIWTISTRTLKLCMEDTFTDCPLYEQTHWVGDARNESLIAYPVFGSTDLARHCIWQTAQSMERFPMAGCQVPSGWECLLPAWSFLWGISTWDYYWHTGDQEYLRAIYPYAIRNLKGAEQYVNDQGLFSAAFWNLFDWSGIDQGPKTVLHNTLFMVGAIDAALKEAKALGEDKDVPWLTELRQKLVTGANRLWNERKRAYADSIHDDGTVSSSICQHTSILALLYDIVDKDKNILARWNLLEPPADMVRIGSPFAMLYLYEAFEKIGQEDATIKQIYHDYLPMLESGATTVWESFPTGTTGSDGFPTRSHCHAWSSAPSYFLNRIIVGIKATAPGGAAFQLSPRLNGLTWAKGTVATAKGPVSASWKVSGKVLDVSYAAPDGVKVEFLPNSSMKGLRYVVHSKNGKQEGQVD
jgi:alpha-L-rhamnosidase